MSRLTSQINHGKLILVSYRYCRVVQRGYGDGIHPTLTEEARRDA